MTKVKTISQKKTNVSAEAKENKVAVVKSEKTETNKTPNKYEKLVSKKRKLEPSAGEVQADAVKVEPSTKKIRSENAGPAKVQQTGYKKDFNGKKKPFEANNGAKKPFKRAENTSGSKDKATILDKKAQKELRTQRRQKKLADTYDTTINVKKIWETLRKAETTEETKKKLCASLYDHVKGRIYQMALAHDTCRVIECLVQYGNERQRTGVFDELKGNLVDLSKSKYARFMIKKILTYCDKAQKDVVIGAFTGRVTKLIKHSFACQIVETVFNEHASFAQRNQMLMEFYDPTLAILNEKKYKTLSDILVDQPFSKEKILANLKEILTGCITKTLLMFSIVHRVFLEYLQNCDTKQRNEMIDLLGEHLVHMLHTKDGAHVAMLCIWYGSAKDRKKIIKSLKSFVVKIALEEQGHLILLSIFDSVDDTKFISKAVLEELFRQIKELFDNEYGRKVLTYLIAPRDSRFFIKQYVKQLEAGDKTETSKKDPEIRRNELFDYSKAHLKTYLNKEMANMLYNGAGGILLPLVVDKLGKDADELLTTIGDVLLAKPYELIETLKSVAAANDAKINDNNGDKPKTEVKQHYVEDATCHYLIKKLAEEDTKREASGHLTLGQALLANKNSMHLSSWIDCNRGCFALVKLIEAGSDKIKKGFKLVLEDCLKTLEKTEKSSGAKLLLTKLNEIK